MTIKPLNDQIFIAPIVEDESVTESGIVLKESNTSRIQEGVIVAVGKGKVLPNGNVRELEVAVGDKVMYELQGAQVTRHEGNDYVVVREEGVVGVLTHQL